MTFGNTRFWGATMILGASAGSAPALDIVLDFTHDSYFQTNATALAALDAAAADLEAAITSVLPARTDIDSATVGFATASLDWSIDYQNPFDGSTITLDPAELVADEVRIFVGARPITQPGDPTPTLGAGQPANGIGFQGSAEVAPIFLDEVPQAVTDLGNAVAAMAAQANFNAARGGNGPLLGSLNSSFSGTFAAGTAFEQSYDFPFTVDYGISVGSLWFDADTDDNGTFDNNATLNSYWHWDHTTAPSAGQIDFYSVALHEMLHTLGFGSSVNWDALVNPADPDEWLGPALIEVLGGSGNNAVDTVSGAHLATGLSGNVFGTSVAQEAAMDPDIDQGERKLLTDLDAAVLDDIGWQIAVVSDLPGDYNGDGFVSQADLDLVLLNWGDAEIPAEWVNPDAWDGVQVSQNELDGVLLNWGDGTPPSSSVAQTDLDLVLLNWGDSVLPAGFDESAISGGGVSQSELDGILLNWASGTPPSATPVGGDTIIPEPTAAMAFAGLTGAMALRRRR